MVVRILTTAVGALSLCSAPACALPAGNALLAGGSLASSSTHPRPVGVNYSEARIDPSGQTLTFFGDWGTRCSHGGAGLATFKAAGVAIAADGSFTASGSAPDRGPGGSQVTTYSLAGSFVGDNAAVGSGTARVAVRPKHGKRFTCRAAAIRFRIVDPTHPASVAQLAPATQYFGLTSKDFPTIMRTDAAGTALSSATVEYFVTCVKLRNRTPVTQELFPGPVRIAADGSFSATHDYSTDLFVPGRTARFHVTLAGRFAGGHLTGTWRVRVRLIDPKTHRQADSCTSGPLSFRSAQ